jgi:hypothetical protein
VNYVYLAAYRVLGISHPEGSPDLVLWECTNPVRRLVLTSRLDELFEIIDRQTALAVMMLRGLISNPVGETFDASLNEHIADIRSQRGSSSYPAVVFEARGEVEANLEGPGRDLDRFEIRWDVFNKDALRALLANDLSASLTAIRISSNTGCKFEALGDGAYLIKADGRTLHSFTAKMGSLTAFVSRRLDETMKQLVPRLVSGMLRQPEICNVAALFAMALELKSDRYKGFVTAWSALEILTGKLFRRYEDTLLAKLEGESNAPGLKSYLDRVKQVMNGKYTLVDRFIVLSIFLGGDQAAGDIARFKTCKEIRDKLFHGKQIPDSELPMDEVFGLLDKYLRNFLESV